MAVETLALEDRFHQFHSHTFMLLERVAWVIDHHPDLDSDAGLELVQHLIRSFSVSYLEVPISG